MREHKHKHGMIDNRMVNDNHKQGIERVKQRKSEHYKADVEGHYGKMGRGDKAHWSRRGDSLTPRKA